MKTTPNPAFSIKGPDGKEMTAAGILLFCLSNPPQGGFDFATMRARNKVADAVEKLAPGAEITLEDAEHATAVEAVRAMKWTALNKDLLKFGELFGL